MNMLNGTLFTQDFWIAALGRNSFEFDGVLVRRFVDYVHNYSHVIYLMTEYGTLEIHDYAVEEGCSGVRLVTPNGTVQSHDGYIGTLT
jgi:hypothetical protein